MSDTLTKPDHHDEALERARAVWLEALSEHSTGPGIVSLPAPPMLTERHLENARMLPHRDLILNRMRVGSTCAEVGVQTGNFSRQILDRCRPEQLVLIDLDLQTHRIAERFGSEIDSGVVKLHEGDSSSILATFPDQHFDFVYIDADHSYEGVKRDTDVACRKIKERGVLIFNDYTYWSPKESMRYGIMQAVNELCLAEDWEVIFFALEPFMYCDVAVRRKS